MALLDDVKIMFNHARSEEEARNAWYKRRDRINFENLYIILYDRDGLTEEDIRDLQDVPCKRLVVLSESAYPDIPYVKTMKRSQKPRPNAAVYLDKDWSGRRSFEKQFDYIAWLNDEPDY